MYHRYYFGCDDDSPSPWPNGRRLREMTAAAWKAIEVVESGDDFTSTLEHRWGVSLSKPWPQASIPWVSEYYEGVPVTPI